MQFDTKGVNAIMVEHDSWMEGGGTWFGQDYLTVIPERYQSRRFQKCFEWCSGPGFIGFALLAHGICDQLCLLDKFEPAIERARQTVQNHTWCQDRVTTYTGSTLDSLPSTELFDLVVANPPHWLGCPGDENYQRIAVDPDWQAHRVFYQQIAQHLLPNGVILMQENLAGSMGGAAEFADMIQAGGLEIRDSWHSSQFFDRDSATQIYYIEIAKK